MNRQSWLALAMFLLLPCSAYAGNNGTIDLAWDPEAGVDGFFIYWGTTSGGPYPNQSPPIPNLPSPEYVLTGLTDCTMYYFVATSFQYTDDAGAYIESAYSNEVSSWPSRTITGASPSSAAQGDSFTLTIQGTWRVKRSAAYPVSRRPASRLWSARSRMNFFRAASPALLTRNSGKLSRRA